MQYTVKIVVTDILGEVICDIELSPEHAIQALAETLRAGPKSEPKRDAEVRLVGLETNGKPPKRKKRKQNQCSACGKPGHSRRTCPNTQEATEGTHGNKLTEEEFDEIKSLGALLQSEAYATEHGVPVAEVKRAVTSDSYAEYLDW